MSKEEFYKYGESLGIKVNDLQRSLTTEKYVTVHVIKTQT